MFDELKKLISKKVMRKVLISTGVLLIILLVISQSLIKFIKGPTDLNSISIDELKGSYVEADIDTIFGAFASLTETESKSTRTTKQYYIIPVGEYELIGLEVLKSDIYEADRIMNSMSTSAKPMHVKGTIKKMSSDLEYYYYQWFDEYMDEDSAEYVDEYALTYVLEINKVGFLDVSILYVALFICAAILLYIIIILVKMLSGLNLSKIKKFLNKNETTDHLGKVESDYFQAVPIETIRVGKSYTFYFKGTTPNIIRNHDIIWAYLKRTTHRTNGLKTGVTKSLLLNTRTKKTHTIDMKKEENITFALEQYSNNNPHIILGFSDDLQKTYKKAFNEFLNMSKKQEAENVDNTFNI